MSDFKIPWMMCDPRFKPGTAADIGDIRLTLRMTDRKSNNKWRLYMEIRTHKENGVKDDLKYNICVAEFPGTLSLQEIHPLAERYFQIFMLGILKDWQL